MRGSSFATGGGRSHQDNNNNNNVHTNESHDFQNASGRPPNWWQTEQDGHIWHESHVRENGAGTKDNDDEHNSPNSEWNSCVGLLDAARALQPYGMSQSSAYATQAANTRTYLEGLALAMQGNHPPDYYYTCRAQAMLDFIYSEVDPTQGAFALAVNNLGIDHRVFTWRRRASSTFQRFWIQGALFNSDRSVGGSTDTGGFDPAVYCPADPIFYAIDHHVQDPLFTTCAQAINYIVDNWYDSATVMRAGNAHNNPLRIAINWSPAVNLEEYYGRQSEINKHAAVEGYAVARFAQHLGRADSGLTWCRLQMGT